MAAEVEDAGLIDTLEDEEDEDQEGSQWFNNTIEEEIGEICSLNPFRINI